jgi:hypothetical protein
VEQQGSVMQDELPELQKGNGPGISAAAIAAWCLAVGIGLTWMLRYEFTPAATVQAPHRWPADSSLARLTTGPTLLMFVHPRCPCSRASIEQLGRVVSASSAPLRLFVVVLRPERMPAGWERTDLWQAAAAIPGAQVVADVGGAEALRFAARASGETRCYDASGRLIFHGGITASRGHGGDNPGQAALAALLVGTASSITSTPVFGCALHDERDCPSCRKTPSPAL